MTEGGGFFCDMKAMTRDERGRYEVLRAKLEAAVVSVEELPDGYLLRLRHGAIATEELGEWIAYERKCCPFFTLIAEGRADSGRLRITGRDGVKDFIRAEFSTIRFE